MKIYMHQRPNKCYRNTDYYMVEKFRKLGELFRIWSSTILIAAGMVCWEI